MPGTLSVGGKLLADTSVKIKKVLLFRKLNPAGQRPLQSTYYVVGNSSEQFLIHKISSLPDFDHIVQVQTGPVNGIQETIFPFPDTRPAVEGHEIYFETGDLSL